MQHLKTTMCLIKTVVRPRPRLSFKHFLFHPRAFSIPSSTNLINYCNKEWVYFQTHSPNEKIDYVADILDKSTNILYRVSMAMYMINLFVYLFGPEPKPKSIPNPNPESGDESFSIPEFNTHEEHNTSTNTFL